MGYTRTRSYTLCNTQPGWVIQPGSVIPTSPGLRNMAEVRQPYLTAGKWVVFTDCTLLTGVPSFKKRKRKYFPLQRDHCQLTVLFTGKSARYNSKNHRYQRVFMYSKL